MPTDDAVIHRRLRAMAEQGDEYGIVARADVQAVLTALAAAERDRLERLLNFVNAQRDEMHERATRLEALETAAIAYRAWFIAYDGLGGTLVEGHRLLTALRQATAALAATTPEER